MYLIGSSDVSAFTTDTVYDTNEYYAWRVGDTSVGLTPSANGTINRINLYITSWNSMPSIKICLYEDNALLESTIVNSTVGTGFVPVTFPDTAVVTTSKYKLAFYLLNGDGTITLKTKAGDGKYRGLEGSYATPSATLTDGSWFGSDEFYWSAESTETVLNAIDVSGVSDVNPFPTPAGWTALGSTVEVVDGALVSSDGNPAYLIYDNVVSANVSLVTFTVEFPSSVVGIAGGVFLNTTTEDGLVAGAGENTGIAHTFTGNIADLGINVVTGYGSSYVVGTEIVAIYDKVNSLLRVTSGGNATSVTITGDFSPGLVLSNGGTVSTVEVTGLSSWLDPNGWTPSVYPNTTTFSAYGLSTITSFSVGGYELFDNVESVVNNLYTLNLAGFVYGSVFPALGTVDVVVEDDEATTLEFSTTLYTMTGYVTVTIAGAIDDSEGTIASLFPSGDPLQVGEVIHYPNGDGQTINPNSTIENWPEGVYTLWVRRYDGIMYSFTITVLAP